MSALCGECGMSVQRQEYHPFAACLMFKACHDGTTVRANLDAVRRLPRVEQDQTWDGGWVLHFGDQSIAIATLAREQDTRWRSVPHDLHP